MKLEIPVKVYFDDVQGMIDEIKRLQTYKLFEGDDMVLVDLDAVVAIMANHVKADKCSEISNNSDTISRQAAIDARRYTFGNEEFSLEDAYHDCKLVFDGITDDDSFQEADTGLILYYANEIIYALQEALESKDTNVPTNDYISRRAAIECLEHLSACDEPFVEIGTDDETFIGKYEAITEISDLPSAKSEPISEEYAKAVRTWLINYQVRCAELEGRYTPYEVLGWIVSDWRKENEIW